MSKGASQSTLLPLSNICPSPTNPRGRVVESDVTELAESVKSLGILQPILVRPLDEMKGAGSKGGRPKLLDKNYEIIAGERRFVAAQLAGLEKIPAIIRVCTPLEAALMQAVENDQREDLDVLSQVDCYARLEEEFHQTAEQIAEHVGKSTSWVYQRLQLRKLAPIAREALRVWDWFSPSHGVEMARLSPEEQNEFFKDYNLSAMSSWPVASLQRTIQVFRDHLDKRQQPSLGEEGEQAAVTPPLIEVEEEEEQEQAPKGPEASAPIVPEPAAPAIPTPAGSTTEPFKIECFIQLDRPERLECARRYLRERSENDARAEIKLPNGEAFGFAWYSTRRLWLLHAHLVSGVWETGSCMSKGKVQKALNALCRQCALDRIKEEVPQTEDPPELEMQTPAEPESVPWDADWQRNVAFHLALVELIGSAWSKAPLDQAQQRDLVVYAAVRIWFEMQQNYQVKIAKYLGWEPVTVTAPRYGGGTHEYPSWNPTAEAKLKDASLTEALRVLLFLLLAPALKPDASITPKIEELTRKLYQGLGINRQAIEPLANQHYNTTRKTVKTPKRSY